MRPRAPARPGTLAALTALLTLCVVALPGTAAGDSLISDRVVVLEADGRTHTVQHTLFSDGVLVTLTLPGSVIPQRVAFGGPERLTFRNAWLARPERLALWSGSAFARYRHQYGDEVQRLADGGWRLSVSSRPAWLAIEPAAGGGDDSANGTDAAARTGIASTWVFPSDVDVLDWQADGAAEGAWTFEDNSLGWQQAGDEPVGLTITYRTRGTTAPLADSLAPPSVPPVAQVRDPPPDPSPDGTRRPDGGTDEDGDGVPDARDVCLGPARAAPPSPWAAAATAERLAPPIPGCDGERRVVLDGVGFDTGASRLDADARRALDRVAGSLGTGAGPAYEIGAHTDNQGRWTSNLALSDRRARAVRQYLLLRGVPAERLSATGHGESRPIGDNADAQGRRENRRIELGPLPHGAPDEP